MKRVIQNRIWDIQFILLLFINTAVFLGFNMSTAGFPAYVSLIGTSNISTGMVTTLSAVAALTMRPLAGALIDIRNSKKLVLVGLFLLSSPLACVHGSNIGAVLVVRFLQGAGWGIVSTACSKLISNNLPQERLSEGIAYAGALSSIATAFAPGLAIALLEKGPSLMLGVISACSAISIIAFLALRQQRDITLKKEPRNIVRLVSREAIVPSILIMTISMTYAPMVTFIAPYSEEIGISGTKLFFLAYALSTIASRLLTGIYVDRRDVFLPTVAALTASVLASASLANCHNMVMFLAAGVFAGIGIGAGMTALQTSSIKNTAPTMRGGALATFLFGFDFGMAFGSLSAGMLLNFFEYANMFMAMALSPAIALVAVATLSVYKRNLGS